MAALQTYRVFSPMAANIIGTSMGAIAEPEGPAGDAKRVGLSTEPRGEGLGWADERDHEPGRAEDEHVEEHHGGSCCAVLLFLVGVVDGGAVQGTDSEADGTPVECASPADAV